MTRIKDWLIAMKIKQPSWTTQNETVLFDTFTNDETGTPTKMRESFLQHRDTIVSSNDKGIAYNRFGFIKQINNGQRSCISIFLLVFLMLCLLILPIIYVLHCFGLVQAYWSNKLFVPIPHIKHNIQEIRYEPDTRIHEMLVEYRSTRSIPAPTQSPIDYCSDINDIEKVDCHPEFDSSEIKCINRGCCWKTSTNTDINVPFCYHSINSIQMKNKELCNKFQDEEKLDCFPEAGSSERLCLARDCCWEPKTNNNFDVPYCYYRNITGLPTPPKPAPNSCSNFNDQERIDCYPENGASDSGCQKRGCCWAPPKEQKNQNVPYCFFPQGYGGYIFINVTETAYGWNAYLNRTFRSPYPKDIRIVKMKIELETDYRLHIKIVDAEKARWEPPYPEVPIVNKRSTNQSYSISIQHKEGEFVGFKVTRNSDMVEIWNSNNIGAFIFSDQFLQISTKLSTKNIYGLGEHETRFKLSTQWNRLALFNSDQMPMENAPLYGSHPMYLALENSGNAHGVFLLNSNAMDVVLQDMPAVTFRTIGGVLDLYIMSGPSPADVIRQYTDIVGHPAMPPLWGLGYHLCRYGYKTLNRTQFIMQRNLDAGIPLDVQWNDLDYMQDNNGFTLNENTFGELPKFVKSLHERGMHYVPIIDPGVSGSEPAGSYPPYDKGIEIGIFVMNGSSLPFIGKVWNTKSTVWPDFTNPRTLDYWTELFKDLHNKFEFDGAWIDMNEPSNFLSGSVTGCPESSLETPQYVPAVNGGKLNYKTMCMTSKHYAGNHYNVHNLYGMAEAIVTNFALAEIRGKRPFIISRSSFSGLGRYAGHWTGDVLSSWSAMAFTIPQMLRFSLYGVPLVGADICGFNGNTTAPLCQRWAQLGAFYPFARNHNTDNAIDQDPAAFDEDIIKSTRKALRMRYELIPYLYTLFWHAHVFGETVARPLFFEYPKDHNTYDIDDQFLWGSGIMVCPVLKENIVSRTVYFPAGVWYSLNNFSIVVKIQSGESREVKAPPEVIPVYIKGGQILPMQKPALNTYLMRNELIRLVAAPDQEGKACGQLFWDDGESLNTIEELKYSLLNIDMAPGKMFVNASMVGIVKPPPLGRILILGVSSPFNKFTINGKDTAFRFDTNNKYILVDKLNIPLTSNINILWK